MKWLCAAVLLDGKIWTWKATRLAGSRIPTPMLSSRYFPNDDRVGPVVVRSALVESHDDVAGWYERFEMHPDAPEQLAPNSAGPAVPPVVLEEATWPCSLFEWGWGPVYGGKL